MSGSPRMIREVTDAGAGFRHHGDTVVHNGYVWNVVVGEYESPDGEHFKRDIVRSPGAVGVVALTPPADHDQTPRVVLVAQYRPPYDQAVIEIPAGVRDVEGEPIAETARRELIEEAGLDPGTVVPLTDLYPSPGMTDSVTSIVLATDCRRVDRDVHGPEERHMQLLEIPLADAVEMVERGQIVDAKSVAGLLLTERRLHNER